MAENQVYLIKSGQNSFVEETEAVVGISGGKVGIGTTAPEADLHVTGSVKVGGDLAVDGTFTTINSSTVSVDDKNIELGSTANPTDITADGGGITVKGETDKTFNWLDATDAWTSSEHLYLANGKHFSADELRALDGDGLKLSDQTASGVLIKGGKVGIHQASPVYDLDVDGSGNFASLYVDGNAVLTGEGSIFGKWEDGATAGEIYYNAGNVGVGVIDPSAQLHVVGSTLLNGSVSASGINAIDSDGLTLGDDAGNGIFVEDGGQIGINTTSPGYNLHVNGSTHIGGEFSVGSEFKISAGGAIGGTAPASDGDIIKWDDANNKWVAGANLGGGGGGGVGEVPAATINSLPSGQSIYEIEFAETYNVEPRIATQLEIDGEGSIIPYVVSGVSTSGYHLIFAQDIPNNNYRIHTTFGGRDVHWETGAGASLYYNDGDVSIQRNFTIGGNLTVNGTTTTVNTETVEIEDHNLVIAANTGYNQLDSQYPAGGAYAGVLWGTGDAGAASPVSLTYQTNKGFAFEGGNVGIGTTLPGVALHVFSGADNDNTILESSDTAVTLTLKDSTGAAKIESRNDFRFSNNAGADEIMRLTADGNVGIGTTTPETGYKLDVRGKTIVREQLRILGTTGDSGSGHIVLQNNFSTGSRNFYIGNDYTDTSTTPNGLSIKTSSYNTTDWDSATTRMHITEFGNVGIGTTDPSFKLDVHGQGADIAVTWTDSTDPENPVVKSSALLGSTSVGDGILQLYNADGTTSSRIRTDADSYVLGGNFGIGTTSPEAPLTISKVHSDSADGIDNFIVLAASEKTNQDLVRDDGVGILFKIPVSTESQSVGARIAAVREGTTDSNSSTDLLFQVSNNDQVLDDAMRITRDGNVGIGTMSPSAKLSITNGGAEGVEIQPGLSSGLNRITNFNRTTSAYNKLAIDASEIDLRASGSSVVAVSDSVLTVNPDSLDYDFHVKPDTGEGLFVQGSSGNVGIGTTNPDTQLEVTNASNTEVTSKFYNGGGSAPATVHIVEDGSASDHVGLFVGASDLSSAVLITKQNNVGIGTTNPVGKLHVNDFRLIDGYTVQTTATGVTVQTSGDMTSVLSDGDTVRISGNTYTISNLTSSTFTLSDPAPASGSGLAVYVYDDALTIKDGNVGIGATNPGSLLELKTANGSGKMAEISVYSDGLDNNATSSIFLGQSLTRRAEITAIRAGTGNSHSLAFSTNAGAASPVEAMRISASGNVGIGTTNPSNKLSLPENSGITWVRPDNTDEASIINNEDDLIITAQRGSGSIILDTNNVGIGVTHPAQELDVNGSIRVRGKSADFGSGTTTAQAGISYHAGASIAYNLLKLGHNDSEIMNVAGSGNVHINGTLEFSSDDRVKHNEQAIVGAIETLGKITPKKYIKTTKMYEADHNFELDEDGNPVDANGEPVEHSIEAGVIAQQVLEVPELAFTVSPEGVGEDGNVTSPHGLNYNSLFTYAIAAIQEQQSIIEELKSQNASLESRISALES